MKFRITMRRVSSVRHRLVEDVDVVVEADGAEDAEAIADEDALELDELDWDEVEDEVVGSDHVDSVVTDVVHMPDATEVTWPPGDNEVEDKV